MRPNRLTVPLPESRSFDLRHERVPYFANPWHFHPELELNYVVTGTGTRFIGQSVERFEGGEIILLGRNLPHYWKSDAVFYGPDHTDPCEAVVVRFAEDFVGKAFLELPETRRMQTLFGRATLGLRLLEPLRSYVANALIALPELTGFNQLAALLGLLNDIAESDNVAVVSPRYVPSEVLEKQSERLNRVMAYLNGAFHRAGFAARRGRPRQHEPGSLLPLLPEPDRPDPDPIRDRPAHPLRLRTAGQTRRSRRAR